MPPLPGVVTVIVSVGPTQITASAGLLAITGAIGSATTVQLTWFTFEAQPVPVLFLRLSTRFVPVTAAKLGMVELHALHAPPLFVEYLYSSVFVPVPPLPAVVTEIDRVAPEHNVASVGFFAITGAIGSAITVQETWFDPDVEQPGPDAVLRL